LRAPPSSRRVDAVVVDARAEGSDIVVRFGPTRGDPTPIEDRIRLEPRGELSAVEGVGRILRILRAGRVQSPKNPYDLPQGLDEILDRLNRCAGARLYLHLAQRMERILSVWTEAGVDRIGDVVDFGEDAEGLWVRRRGGQSLLRIPRRSLIRYASHSFARPEVVSVEIPSKQELR
jgi:hypothetical protein